MTLESFFESFGAGLTELTWLSLPIALLAGIVSSGVCPCTLPVGLGIAGMVSSNTSAGKRNGFFIALAFFAGIVVNLALLGAVAGRLGVILTESFGRYWALMMVFFSVAAAFAAFWGPRLKNTKLASMRKPGISGSFVYGFVFSLGTSAAPLLLLLSIAAATADPVYGLLLALFFGIGRGLPFLLVGIFAGAVTRLARLSWLRANLQLISGVALLFVGFYFAKVFYQLMS